MNELVDLVAARSLTEAAWHEWELVHELEKRAWERWRALADAERTLLRANLAVLDSERYDDMTDIMTINLGDNHENP